jgi:predicted ATP-dependent serine protease
MAFEILQDIPYQMIPRVSSEIQELDWLYGGSGYNWGFPEGKISLWSGPSGTGKSRSLISVAKSMSFWGHNVLFFQNEVTLTDFRAWTGTGSLPNSLYASDTTSLEEQISDIRSSHATIVIVDSVNQINEFGSGHKSAIKLIYDKYRKVTKETGVHVIFICQLDKKNQIKGGSELKFLADIHMSLGHYIVDNEIMDHHFTVSVGSKHRYGKMGSTMNSVWQHTKDGASCISNNRLYDKEWCESHKLKLLSRPVLDSSRIVSHKAPSGYYDKPIYGNDGTFLYEAMPTAHVSLPLLKK